MLVELTLMLQKNAPVPMLSRTDRELMSKSELDAWDKLHAEVPLKRELVADDPAQIKEAAAKLMEFGDGYYKAIEVLEAPMPYALWISERKLELPRNRSAILPPRRVG